MTGFIGLALSSFWSFCGTIVLLWVMTFCLWLVSTFIVDIIRAFRRRA